MRATVTVDVPRGANPFMSHATASKRSRVREFMAILKGVVDGSSSNSVIYRPTVRAGLVPAWGTGVLATIAAADTVTIGGQALTCTKQNATGTIQIGASIDVDDSVDINGVTFTGKAAESISAAQFKCDGTATAAATSLAACINGSTSALIKNIVWATSSADTVTVRAHLRGIAGNVIPTVASDGDITCAAATLTAGAAWVVNQFDPSGNNAIAGRNLCEAINKTTTAIISKHVMASNKNARFTFTSCAEGVVLTVGGVQFRAVVAANLDRNTFLQSGDNDADALAFATAVNAHPGLLDKVFAVAGTAICDIYEIPRPYTKTLASITLVSVKTGATVSVAGQTFTSVAVDTGAVGSFLNTGSDTADASMLCNAINCHPSLTGTVLASSVAGVVTVLGRDIETIGVASSGASVVVTCDTVACTKLTEGLRVFIVAKEKGHAGNQITIANSARCTMSGARMTGGTDEVLTF